MALPSRPPSADGAGHAAPLRLDGDHVAGPDAAPHLILMYGDYECPYTRAAHQALRILMARLERTAASAPRAALPFRYAFRHFPLRTIHPHAQAAAEAAEAAHAQGQFWTMHDHLFAHQRALADDDLRRHAGYLGLDVARFAAELAGEVHAGRVERDVQLGLADAVRGTPTVFVDGVRYGGARTVAAFAEAVGLVVDEHETPDRDARPA